MNIITVKRVAYSLLFISMTIVSINSCNLFGTNAKNSVKTGISFVATTAGSSTQNVMPTTSTNGGFTMASTSTGLQIDTAKVLIEKLEFHSASEDSLNGNEDSLDFKQGPFVMNLNLDSTLTKVAIDNVPPGTYDGISFLIHKPGPNETVSDPEFVTGPNEDQHFSVVVKGFYNGTHFVFKSQRSAEVHIRINPPLNISDSLAAYNTTIKVNVNSWFTDQNGNTLDPTNPNNADAIDSAIQRSFHGFEDNNHDGIDDHKETHG